MVVSVVPFLRLPEAVVLCCEFRGLHVGECIHFKSPAPLVGVGIVFLDLLLVRLRRCGGGALPCPWSTASRAFSSTAPTRQCRRMQFLKIPSIVPKGKPSCFWKKGTTRLNNSALKRHVTVGVTGARSSGRG